MSQPDAPQYHPGFPGHRQLQSRTVPWPYASCPDRSRASHARRFGPVLDDSVRVVDGRLDDGGIPRYRDPTSRSYRDGTSHRRGTWFAEFLFDAGVGVTRRITAARLPLPSIAGVFFTHLHSDHTLEYPDLIFTTWNQGRRTPLDIYVPHGLRGMTDAIYEAWKENIDVRTNGLEHLTPGGYRVGVHEISRALCSTAVA